MTSLAATKSKVNSVGDKDSKGGTAPTTNAQEVPKDSGKISPAKFPKRMSVLQIASLDELKQANLGCADLEDLKPAVVDPNSTRSAIPKDQKIKAGDEIIRQQITNDCFKKSKASAGTRKREGGQTKQSGDNKGTFNDGVVNLGVKVGVAIKRAEAQGQKTK